MNSINIITAIREGNFSPEELRRISEVIREQSQLNYSRKVAQNLISFKRGDIIEINGIRPQSLNKAKGKIVHFSSKLAEVELLHSAYSSRANGRSFSAGQKIKIPIGCCKILSGGKENAF